MKILNIVYFIQIFAYNFGKSVFTHRALLQDTIQNINLIRIMKEIDSCRLRSATKSYL